MERILLLDSLPCDASASLATKQFYAVQYQGTNTSGNQPTIVLATAAANMLGILQDKPVQGEAGAIGVFGVTKAAISASQTVAIGGPLEVDTGGTLKAHASGVVVAKARQAVTSVASVQIFEVEIMKSAA